MPVFAKAFQRSVSEKSNARIKKWNDAMAQNLSVDGRFTVDVDGKFTPQQTDPQGALIIAPSADGMEREV
jgi:hypothetical protein